MNVIDQLADDLKNNRLTLMEEARALQVLMPRRRSIHGLSLREIGRRIGRSYSWVNRRLVLFSLPLEVQQATEDGIFTASDLEIVASVPKLKQKRAALRILEEKKEGRKVGLDDLKHKTTRQSAKRIKQMMDYLINKGVGGLPTRLLAWCLGRVDDQQMHTEIKNSIGETYEPEEDVSFPGRID